MMIDDVMTTEEMIEVMQAYAEGKTLQIKSLDKWQDIDFEPSWDWSVYQYRIKPEPKSRPFKNCSELIEFWENNYCQHRPKNAMPLIWVKPKNGLLCYAQLITEFWSDGVCFGPESLEKTFDTLFTNYTFLDEKPCGVID